MRVNDMNVVKAVTVMKGVKIAGVGAVVLASLVATPVATQVPAPIPIGAKVGEPAPSASSYNSLGRRDPFVSLVTPRRATNSSQPRVGTGLASFVVSDVVVTGITKVGTTDTRIAILQSVDKQSYVAKVKDRLFDAVIKSIDATSVVFVEIPEPGSFGRPREIRKFLHPLDEVNR